MFTSTATLTQATGAAPVTETRPATEPIPAETLPDDPNDGFGVGHQIIEEIEKIGRRYNTPRR